MLSRDLEPTLIQKAVLHAGISVGGTRRICVRVEHPVVATDHRIFGRRYETCIDRVEQRVAFLRYHVRLGREIHTIPKHVYGGL